MVGKAIRQLQLHDWGPKAVWRRSCGRDKSHSAKALALKVQSLMKNKLNIFTAKLKSASPISEHTGLLHTNNFTVTRLPWGLETVSLCHLTWPEFSFGLSSGRA